MNTGPTILQVLPSLVSGGVERGTIEMAQAIADAEGKALIASSGGELATQLAQCGATHFKVPLATKNPWCMYRNADTLAALMRTHRVNVVHARSRAPAWSTYLAAKKTGIPLVTTFHGVYGLNGAGKKLYNSVMTKGKRVIAVSHFVADHIIRNYDISDEKIRVIHRGVDVTRFHPDALVESKMRKLIQAWQLQEVDVPILLMPARITRWKGHEVVLQALAKLPHRDFLCIFAGDVGGHNRYYESLQNLVLSLRLAGCVRFVPPTTDMVEAYMLSNVVLCPSIEPEAFGRVAVEAQAMGRPVIATSHGGACETVLNGETGWLVTSGKAQELAEAVHQALMLSDDRRQAMAQQAMGHVARHFTLNRMQHQTLDVYEEVLSEH